MVSKCYCIGGGEGEGIECGKDAVGYFPKLGYLCEVHASQVKREACYWVVGIDGEEMPCHRDAFHSTRFGWLCDLHADEAARNTEIYVERAANFHVVAKTKTSGFVYNKIPIETNLPDFLHKSTKKRKSFIPPSLEEIKKYIADNNYHVIAEDFFKYFTEGNWTDSKGNKVKNWKQKLITWEQYKKKEKGNNGYAGGSQQPLDCERGTAEDKYTNLPTETIDNDNT